MWEIFTDGQMPYKDTNNSELKSRLKSDFKRQENRFRCNKPRVTSDKQEDMNKVANFLIINKLIN